jgi:hypothetical protein
MQASLYLLRICCKNKEGVGSRMKSVATPNLRAFAEQLPKARMGMIRVLWPAIQECLTVGHSLRDIHRTLHLDGIEMPYSTLCRVVAKLQRNVQPRANPLSRQVECSTAQRRAGERTPAAAEPDPLRNLRRLSENRPGFEYKGPCRMRSYSDPNEQAGRRKGHQDGEFAERQWDQLRRC